ncbi:redoxin domain-containing protein [bacterium]|nr:redoxin domain-containing protein [bacterium]
MHCQSRLRTIRSLFRCILLALLLCAAAGSLSTAHAQTDMRAEDKMDSQALPDFTTLWNFNDPAGTRAKFEEILPQAEASGNTAYLAELLTQVARTYGLQEMFGEAHATLDRVEGMLSGDGMDKARLRYLLERGRAFNSSKKPELAQPLFLEAYELGLTTEFDGLTIDAAHMLGIVTSDDESLDWNHRALDLAEKTADEKAANWKGALYNNMGMTYLDSHQPQQALELFQKGVEFREAMGHGEQSRMIAHWTVARALRALGRHPEALEKLAYIADNFPGHSDNGFWYEEMGENMLATGDMEGAKAQFSTAIPMLEAMGWVGKDYPGRIERLQANIDTGLPLLEIGSQAPDFTLPNQDGEDVSLAQVLASGPVVLAFYPKDHTGGCTLELAEYNRREGEFEQFNARVFGISGDSTESHEEFCAAQGYRLDLLADTGNEVRTAYGAITGEGRVGRVSYVIGSDGYISGFCASSSDMQAHAAAALEILGRITGIGESE